MQFRSLKSFLFCFPATLFLACPAGFAQNRFSLPTITLLEGTAGRDLFLHCTHDFTVTAYSISLRYDPAKVEVLEITTDGTDVAPEHWIGSHDEQKGEFSYGAILDFSDPSTDFLPPGDHTLARIRLSLLAMAPAVAELEFADGLSISPLVKNNLTDEGGNTVKAPELDLQSGAITIIPGTGIVSAGPGGAVLIDGGTRAVLFQGELFWDALLQDGSWTGLRFHAGGEGDESALLGGAALYLDDNGSGTFDPLDRQLGSTVSIIADNAEVTFDFSEPIPAGSEKRFFLVVEVVGGGTGAGLFSQAGLLFQGFLLVAGIQILSRNSRLSRGRRKPPGWSRKWRFLAVSCALLVPLAGIACSSGGGGGEQAAPAPSREVRFDLLDPQDLTLEAASTSEPGVIEGLPIQGPALEV